VTILQVVLRPFALVRGGDRMHLEAAGIERPAEPSDDAALAGGVPALEHQERPFGRAEIGLLDELELGLQRAQPPLVIGELHLRVLLDPRKVRTAVDDEVLGVHGGLDIRTLCAPKTGGPEASARVKTPRRRRISATKAL
jgi:hypothetical protein